MKHAIVYSSLARPVEMPPEAAARHKKVQEADPDNPSPEEKLERLSRILQGCGRLAVAFSGGVDSTFLLAFAKEVIPDRVFAITASAPNFSPEETEEAAAFCGEHGIKQLSVALDWEFMNGFSHNPPNRCYLCKKAIFSRLTEAAEENGATCVADGTNADDVSDYRPGLAALSELGVRSPLREAGLTKEEIRRALRERGLPAWSKPAFACLASRIPYYEKITPEKLQAVYVLEKEVRRLGFPQCRVRHHGSVARIEVLPEDRRRFAEPSVMDSVNELALRAGFSYAALDLAGYKMGSLNSRLDEKENSKNGG